MPKTFAIVGGGLGGLAAGIELAQAGQTVTLFEKEPHVGGYAVGFSRKGFGFDVALHVVPAGAPGQPLHRTLERLGLQDSVRLVRLGRSFDVHLGEERFPLPNETEAFYSFLCERFPEERQGLARFRAHLERFAPAYLGVLDGEESKWKAIPRFIPKVPAFLRHGYEPVSAHFARFFRDPRLTALLFQPAVFPCVPMSETPTVNFLLMFWYLVHHGMFTVEGGGPALTRALETRLRVLGGTIETRAKVRSITVARGAATGVLLEDGRHFPASAVLANTSVPALTELLGRESLPAKYLSGLEGLRPSTSVVQLQLGLDCPVRELGVESQLTVVMPDADVDGQLVRQLQTLDVVGFTLTAPGIDDPSRSARQDRVLSAIAAAPYAPWAALSPSDYTAAKSRVAEQLLEMIDHRFPGIRRHVVVQDVATPRTFERYTGNPHGAIMGFRCSLGLHRQLIAAHKLPVRNVHVAGAWTHQLGGFLSSLRAGRRAALVALG